MKKNTSTKNKKGTNIFFIILLLALIIGGSWYAYVKYQYNLAHEETDDAQLESNITAIVPRIQGYIKEIRVKDNQAVKKGDTLIILDDADIKVRIDEAQSAIDAAESQVGIAEAGVSSAQSNIPVSQQQLEAVQSQIEVAKVNLWRTEADYKRYADLYSDHSITKQQYEQALAAKQAAAAQVKVLQEQVDAASQQKQAVVVQSSNTTKQVQAAKANVHRAQAGYETARINLNYTVITAPEDGYVSRINLQKGQLVNPGQSLFNIVNKKLWVIANFKETQLEKMRQGQQVNIKVDAFSHEQFKGVISSLAPATGSKFSLLPPDNASGNFVKVVQRIPVKIDFQKTNNPIYQLLRPGMNVIVDVEIDNNHK